MLAAWLAGRIAIFVMLTSLLGRSLAPADFGFVALATILFALAAEVLDMGTLATVTRRIAANPGEERAELEALLALRRVIASVLFAGIVALAAAGHFPGIEERAALVAVAAGVLVLHFGAYQVAINLRGAFRPVVLLGLALQLAFAFATVAALQAGRGAVTIVALIVVLQAAQALGARRIAMRRLGYSADGAWPRARMRTLLTAAWMVGVAGICYKGAHHAAALLLWELGGAEALATFNAAQRLAAPLGEMSWLFVTPLIAPMSTAAARGGAALGVALEGYAKFLLGVGSTVAVAGVTCAPFILHLMYGDRYASGAWSSVEVFRWLSVAAALGFVNALLVVGELARGNGRALLALGITMLAGVVAATAWAAPRHGAEGVAAALCAAEGLLLVGLAARALSRRELLARAGWLAYLAPAAALAALLQALADSPALQFMLACIWVPLTLMALYRLPAQKATRARIAATAWHEAPGAVPPSS
jgi:O-antigen/teichoic acid export membrane protein